MPFSKLTTKMTLQITSTVEANLGSTSCPSNDLIDQLQNIVRKECVREIDQACAELAISADPYNWNIIDVHKWLQWMRQQMPELVLFPVERIQMNGMTLCSMSKDEFQQHFPGQIGEKLFAKIELWRMAMNFIRPDSFFDSLFPEATDSLTTDYSLQQSAYNYEQNYLQTQSCVDYSSNPSSYASTPYQTSDYGSEAFTSDDEMSDDDKSTLSYSCSNYTTNPSMSYSYSSNCTMSSPHTSSQVGMHQMYAQHHQFVSHSNSSSNAHSQHSYYPHSQTSPQQYYCHTPRSSSVSPSPMHSPSASSSSRSYSPFLESYTNFGTSTSGSNIRSQPTIMTTPVRPMNEIKTQVHNYSSLFSTPPGTPSSITTVSTKAANVSTSTTTNMTTSSSSSHIHLWQFLKELLASPSQFGASIRWLDRSKGVFKIEDSVRVARLWGARKNRPAMNYDKLSRSIRQYYKKGIMKKTERSQRLVYQFCSSYAG